MTTPTKAPLDEVRFQWIRRLIHELYQTERSAIEHPRKEAERLGNDTSAALAMRAVATHAEGALSQIDPMVERLNLPDGQAGEQAGRAFSVGRDLLADKLLTLERSYRGTLLGMTHGVDLVSVLEPLLRQHQGGTELADYLKIWLKERPPLIQACRDELAWFLAHPHFADSPVEDGIGAKIARAVAQGIGKLKPGDTPT